MVVVATREALPLAKAKIHLFYRDSNSDVAEFLSNRDIDSSTGSLRTGPDGRLVLDRVPEGEYVWTINGGEASGEFEVLLGEENVLRIALQG